MEQTQADLAVEQREQKDMRLIGRIVRAARKQINYSQVDLASRLGLEQSAMSRIESGKQNLTAPQWFEVCRATGVSFESIRYGFIEIAQPTTLQGGLKVGSFRLPTKYAYDRGVKVRAILSMLRYFQQAVGQEAYEAYFDKVKIDPDFFLNLENQISSTFVYDFMRMMKETGVFKPGTMEEVAKWMADPDQHGHLRHRYDAQDTVEGLLAAFVKNAAYYECNNRYRFEPPKTGSRFAIIEVIPEAHHIDVAKKNAEIAAYCCEFKQHGFAEFTRYKGMPKQQVQELSCFFKGHDKCVYQISVAS